MPSEIPFRFPSGRVSLGVMMSDADLLRAHHAGDADAFATVLGRHADWMYAVARRRTGDGHAAEDVLQAAAIALAGRTPARNETNMGPWLFGVVRNLSAQSIRAAARRRRHEAAAAAADDATAPGPWPELAAALDDLIARLPRDDAAAVLLRFYEKRRFETGVLDKPFAINRYTRHDKRPAMLDPQIYTGAAYQIGFNQAQSRDGKTFGEALSEMAPLADKLPPNVMCVLSEQTVDDLETVRLDISTAFGQTEIRETLWFAPAYGYLMVRRDYLMNATPAGRPAEVRVNERKRVTMVSESAPSVWTVTAGEHIINVPAMPNEPAHYQRQTFSADAVTANDPAFDNSLFDPAIPAGFNEDR